MDRVVGCGHDGHRGVNLAEFGPRRGHVGGGLLHRVGECRPLPPPGPGQFVAQPGRTRGPHGRGRGGQAVAAQRSCGVQGRSGRGGVAGGAGPCGQRGQDRHGVAGMGQRPASGHRRPQRYASHRDGPVPGCGVQRAKIPGDQTVRLGGHCVQDAAGLPDRPAEGPLQVALVGAGPGQQDGEDAPDADRHRMIVPVAVLGSGQG